MDSIEDPQDRHRKHIDRIDKTIVALEAERERLERLLAPAADTEDRSVVPGDR